MLVSYIRRRLTKSTLLRGVRSRPTCRNAAPHSGECEIHGKDGVAGSIPAGGPHQTSRPGRVEEDPSFASDLPADY
jgi:hypothetical protein